MARKCALTGKKTISGNNRSHALNQTKRNWKPNLQKVTLTIGGKKQTIYATTNGIRTLRKHEAAKKAAN